MIETERDEVSERFLVGAFDNDGSLMSKGTFRYRNTAFGSGYVKTMTAGAVATPVHLRRGGNVRRMFSYMHERAYEDGVAVAILHPFSFSYYNKFGYERVADHLIARLPISKLDFVPRECRLIPYREEAACDLAAIYGRFARGRRLLFERKSPEQFGRPAGSVTYVYYEGKLPLGYITYTTEKTLKTNHYEDGVMYVHELVYTSPESLCALLSFIRMFEGELEEVEFKNIAMSPEADLILRHYTHTRYRVLPDVSAKVINTELMLAAADYPSREWDVTLKIPEGDEGVMGTFKVEYGGGDSKVTRLPDTADADVTLSPLALPRILYGHDGLSLETLPYVDGIRIEGCAEKLLAAFPKRSAGIFEHF